MGFTLSTLLMACTPKESEPSDEANDVEVLHSEIDRTQSFVTTNNQDEQTYVDQSSYELLADGVEDLGRATNHFLSYSIDRIKAYYYDTLEAKYDSATHYVNGEQDETYSVLGTPDAGTISVSLKEFMLVGNGEEEAVADSPLETFDEKIPFGSVYHSILSSDASDERTACATGSPGRYVSEDAAASAPFYSALKNLPATLAVPQNANFPVGENENSISWLPLYRPVDAEAGFAEVYSLNTVAPYFNPGDNPFKGEFGANAGLFTFENNSETVAVLSEDFITSNPEMCFNVFESDGGPIGDLTLGATYLLQTKVPVKPILEVMEDSGLEPTFDLILANSLDQTDVVYAAYCKDNQPLAAQVGEENIPALSDANGRLLDMSAELCAMNSEDMAFLSMAKYGIRQN